MDIGLLALCFTIALCAYVFITKPNGAQRRPDPFDRNRWLYYAILGVLFAVAIGVRIYEFGAVPSGLNQDGAMAAVDAKALADYGTDRFGMRFPAYFTAWDYGQMSVLMSYLMVPFIKIFGLTVTAIRMPTLLLSLAGVLVIFLFARKALGRLPALIVLALAAINPWHIMQSRWALECNLFPHMLLFSLLFLYLGLNKRVYLYVSMALFGLTMYTYGIAFYTTPILMVTLCIYLLVTKRIKGWEAAICAGVYLLIAWPIFAVVAVNAFKWQTIDTGFITIPYFPNSIRTKDLILFSDDMADQLVSNFKSLVSMVVLDRGDFSWSFISGYGHMYVFTLPFIAVGLWRLFARTRPALPDPQQQGDGSAVDNPARFILCAWLCVAVFSGLMVNNVNTNRINIIYYPLIVLTALGVWRVVVNVPQARRVAAAICILYYVAFCGFTVKYFGEHSKVMAEDFCSGLTDAIRYADSLDTDVLYITAYTRSQDAFTCSEIYTLFGADVDARYFQGVAGAVNRSTGKALLPYKERYQYVDLESFPFDKPKGAVYVYNNETESALFDLDGFEKKTFGNFGVAVQTLNADQIYGSVDDYGDNGNEGDGTGDYEEDGSEQPVG